MLSPMLGLAAPRRGRWLLRLFLLFLLLMLGLLLAARIYVPHLIREQAVAILRQEFGPGVQLRDVDLGLGRGTITLRGFSLPAPEGSEESETFAFESLQLDFGALSRVREGEWVLPSVSLIGPHLVVDTPPGTILGPGDLLAASRGLKPPPIDVEQAHIRNGALTWHDARISPPSTVQLTQVNLDLTGLRPASNPSELPTQAKLTAMVFDESPLDLDVRGDFLDFAQGLNFDLGGKLQDLDVTRLRAHFPPGASVQGGRADTELEGTCRDNQLAMTLTITLRGFVGAPGQPPADLEPLVVDVRGDLADPHFDLAQTIAERIREALDLRRKPGGAAPAGSPR
jgi:hypothetical protein